MMTALKDTAALLLAVVVILMASVAGCGSATDSAEASAAIEPMTTPQPAAAVEMDGADEEGADGSLYVVTTDNGIWYVGLGDAEEADSISAVPVPGGR